MNYSSGVWGLGSITVAHTLPTGQVLWLVARVLLDLAGGLFLLYLLAISGIATVVLLPAHRRAQFTGHHARGGPRPDGPS